MSFLFSNISTLLLNNLSNIQTEINNTARHQIISIVLISNTGGKRDFLPPGSFWHSKTYFRRVWNGFWRKFAVSMLNSVWLIEYFDVKSIVLKLFCFALNSSKNFQKIPLWWGFCENSSQQVEENIFRHHYVISKDNCYFARDATFSAKW